MLWQGFSFLKQIITYFFQGNLIRIKGLTSHVIGENRAPNNLGRSITDELIAQGSFISS